MSSDDLEMVLAWRNNPDIRRHMYTQHLITGEEHANWFLRNTQEPSRYLLICEIDGVPAAFLQFTKVTDDNIALWGFYKAPSSGKGDGRICCEAGLAWGFNSLRLKEVRGEALRDNQKSIALHLSLGFRKTGQRKEIRFPGEPSSRVVECFSLRAEDWSMRNDR